MIYCDTNTNYCQSLVVKGRCPLCQYIPSKHQDVGDLWHNTVMIQSKIQGYGWTEGAIYHAWLSLYLLWTQSVGPEVERLLGWQSEKEQAWAPPCPPRIKGERGLLIKVCLHLHHHYRGRRMCSPWNRGILSWSSRGCSWSMRRSSVLHVGQIAR